MKALVLIVSALFAFTASAGEFSKPDSVVFQSASTYVPATKVCRDGDFLKHKTKATIEVEYCTGGKDGDAHCKTVSKQLLQPVVSTAQRCATGGGAGKKDGCQQWETYTLDQSSVLVRAYETGSEQQQLGVVGRYTIPACKTGGGVAN